MPPSNESLEDGSVISRVMKSLLCCSSKTSNTVVNNPPIARPGPKVKTTKIVQINSSAQLSGSASTKLADMIVAKLQQLHPTAKLEVRDLATNPHPDLDGAALGAIFTPADKQTAAQSARCALDDALIKQLQSADILVLGVPMYNFHVSNQFKAWIDAVAKAGVTFKYTADGPVGLLTGKKVYVALSRGGVYRDTPDDVMVPWLTKMLAFLGLTDVQYFYVEGLAKGPDSEKKAWNAVEAEVKRLIV